eukprot:TRINITY_DN17380_c0_g1_i1.p1 TRINITY_DN17380_c0_g1~~TRINITY_DN17380_c0_g1_i1.p1  ORF type:complete len:397 (+),score=43.30 TRINITY_DN17380_c0_g1_i1:25-1215(+)
MVLSLSNIFLFLLITISLSLSFANIYNIVDYGAVGDGTTNDTNAMLEAIQEVKQAGSGTVYVPEGVYLMWPFKMVSHMTLYLQPNAIIIAPSGPENWPLGVLYFIYGQNLENVTVEGGGVIDGQGAPWWPLYQNETFQNLRPSLIVFDSTNNIILRDITLTNSALFHFAPDRCNNIEVVNVTITAPPDPISHNTDGIDPQTCTNVHIRDCYISTGDDNVAVKTNTTNVLVENCIFGNGHGATIGSIGEEADQFVYNVTFRNIIFVNTTNGARIKISQGATQALVQNITFENLRMENVQNSLVINTEYNGGIRKRNILEPAPFVDDVVFENIISNNSQYPVAFTCISEGPCTNIKMTNINFLNLPSNAPVDCQYVYGVQDNVNPNISCLSTYPSKTD